MPRGSLATCTLVGLWILVAAFVTAAWRVQVGQARTARQLADRLGSVEDAILDARWDDARRHLAALEDSWRPVRQAWDLFTEASALAEIDTDLRELGAGLALQNAPVALSAARRVRERILRLPERDRLSWENLF